MHTAAKTRAAILDVSMPHLHKAWSVRLGHAASHLSGLALRIALVYAAIAHAKEHREAAAEMPAMWMNALLIDISNSLTKIRFLHD